jgi:hypothetical protein
MRVNLISITWKRGRDLCLTISGSGECVGSHNGLGSFSNLRQLLERVAVRYDHNLESF